MADADAAPSADEDAVLVGLARAVMAVSLQAAERTGALSLVQLRALTVLSEGQPVNLRRFAHRLRVTDSTASRLIDRLVAADLVNRAAADANRREVALSLTHHGHDMLAAYDGHRLSALRDALESVHPSNNTRLLAELSAFTAELTHAVEHQRQLPDGTQVQGRALVPGG